jgi:hypothetical protein
MSYFVTLDLYLKYGIIAYTTMQGGDYEQAHILRSSADPSGDLWHDRMEPPGPDLFLPLAEELAWSKPATNSEESLAK